MPDVGEIISISGPQETEGGQSPAELGSLSPDQPGTAGPPAARSGARIAEDKRPDQTISDNFTFGNPSALPPGHTPSSHPITPSATGTSDPSRRKHEQEFKDDAGRTSEPVRPEMEVPQSPKVGFT